MNRLARFAGFGSDDRGQVDRDDLATTQAAVADAGAEAGQAVDDPETLREPIIAALRQVHDPEIPVNIYDLGLIYKIDIAGNGDVDVDMTLTAPACPVAGLMPVMVKDAVKTVQGVGEVAVELVWDPPWSPDTMSDEAKLTLGMF
ncbi:SUF system Fe-S cluster assembly protein [Lamprobacter modestohalophilus]|uniref:SUF system Fe-S cluster assembly protein n=1 Tax=Lamprobacter modestohalophilus TaxID=1064514 RepID=UPI002ADEA6AA|nr:SUF system Fe-S cluster assembly protein [Lamprobacter modestohalophilus]MEA1051357.1 SUF system Fe-S cluster assembly protein [Lamprobacter modestohalophilus]